MAIRRLPLEELKNVAKEIFYDYMSDEEEQFFDETEYVDFNEKYPTPMDMLYKEIEDTLAENKARITMFEEAIREDCADPTIVETLRKQLEPILEERTHFTNSCMAYQKKLYAETGLTDYSRNFVRIPLDKKINSYYDNLYLDVLFYDDIAVIKGRYEEYSKLKTKEERRKFIVENTEITNLAFAVLDNSRSKQIAEILILGDFASDERVQQSNIITLDKRFADFDKLTLKETMEVRQNNDLRQLLQTKIDLDKENMKLLADLEIRNSNYKLFRAKDLSDDNEKMLFIRYVCPSTGRVYYNPINTTYLAYSEYFKEDDYDSYLEAWWNVCHVGANPREGRMIRS